MSGGLFTKDSRYLLQETANTYDAHGRITQLTDARGNPTNYRYGGTNDAFLTRITRKIASGSDSLVTELTYDDRGNLESITDEGGSTRSFTYDGLDRLRQVRNDSNVVIRAYAYTYSRTSPNWTFNPNAPNAIVTTTYLQPSVAVVSTEYFDGLGRLIQTVVREGTSYHVTARQYDAMGREWRVWKPYTRAAAGYDANFAANATAFYNSYLSSSSAKPYVEKQYTADALARPKKLIPEFTGTTASAFTTYAYGVDAVEKQRFTETTDESGKKKRSYTDAFGHEVKTVLGYGASEAATTTLAYNVLGQRTQATDPRGIQTTYTLDTRGLLTTRANPDAGNRSHKYDRAGNLRYTQDGVQAAAGQVLFTTYDFANRPLVTGQGGATFSTLNPDAASAPALETTTGNWLVVRKYDAKPTNAYPWSLFWTQIDTVALSNVSGRVSAVASRSNGAWQLELYSYDADGRTQRRHTFTQANGGASVLTALNTTVEYTRDLRDSVTARVVTVGTTTFRHWYDYDARGLLWKLYASTNSTKPATPDVTYTYRPSGEVGGRQFQDGPEVKLRYTIREQLRQIGNPDSTTYPFSARYSYHPNGTVSEAEFYSAGSPAAQKRYRYQFGTASYDALNRLKGADYSGWSGSSWTSTLAHDLTAIGYDGAGNLTTLRRYRENGTLIDNLTYAYLPGTNRLGSVAEAAGASTESWDAEAGSFTYDANGNLKTAGAPYSLTAATYDHRNLPLSLTRAGVVTSYRYDHAGQRTSKQTGSATAEYYVLEGPTTLAVFSVSSSGAASSWHYNVLAGGRVVGRQPSTGARRYYHTDLLGSTRAVVEGAAVVESYDYDPWGLLMPGRTLGSGTKEGFTGKERDAETGLDYFGARYYMAALGRWSSVDPPADSFPSWSPYNYVYNNPVALTDPFGLCSPWPWCMVGAVVGGGVLVVLDGPLPLGDMVAGLLISAAATGAVVTGGEQTVLNEDAEEHREGGNSPAGAPGQTAGGRATDEWGNVLGPSGEPAIHQVNHSTRKGAKDAARAEGDRAPVNHPTPARGRPHFHPTDRDGNKIPNSTHHNYPPK